MKLFRYFNNLLDSLVDFILGKFGKSKHEIEIENIGKIGESEVARELSKLGKGYIILNDLYIPKDNGGTSQIDHLVISEHGIFVIETKNHGGTVIGNEEDLYWEHINSYGKSNKMYSAIRQNEGHIDTLSKFLELNKEIFSSLIVFNGNVDISAIRSDKVIKTDRLVSTILQHRNKKVFDIAKVVIDINNIHTTKGDKRKHIKDVKKQINSNYGECPQCGNKLVLRTSKYGKFIGCSNYPKCTYTSYKTYSNTRQ